MKELAAATRQSYLTGKDSLAEVMQADAQVLQAELELCQMDKERLGLLEKAVSLAMELEKNARQRFQTRLATRAAVLAATVGRLEAEITLEREKAKEATPRPR